MTDYTLKHFRWFSSTLIIISIMSGCGKTQPNTNPVANTTANRPQIFEVPADATTQTNIRIEGAWQSPTNAGIESFEINLNTHTDGPQLSFDNAGNGVLNWQTHTGFNSQTNQFLSSQSHVVHFQSATNQWQEIQSSLDDETLLQLYLDPISGNIFTLRKNTTEIKLGQFHAATPTSTQASKNYGFPNAEKAIFAFNAQGQSIIFTRYQNENGTAKIRASLFSQTGGLNAGINIGRGNADIGNIVIELLSSVINDNGESLIIWQETTNGISSLWSAEFTTNNIWKNIQKVSDNKTSTIKQARLVTNPTNNTTELVIVSHNDNVMRLASLSYTNNQWSEIIELDNTLTGTGNSINNANIADNSLGQIAIVWREKQMTGTQIFYQLQSRFYSPTSGWGAKNAVTQSMQGEDNTLPNNPLIVSIREPRIIINDDGIVAASWIENRPGRSELLVNHYDSVPQKWNMPELVIGYDGIISSVTSASISLNNNGRTIAAWQQKNNTLSNDSVFWVSHAAPAGSGTVAEPPVPVLATAVPDVILPSAVWQTPQEIWTDTIFSNITSFIHGPHLEISNAGTGFISVLKNTDFDPATKGFLNRESIVLNNTDPGIWTIDQPFPSLAGNKSNEINIKTAENGDAFALLVVEGELHFNHYIQGTGWLTEMLIGTTTEFEVQELLIDANGDVWVFWISGSNINLQQYITAAGMNAGLQPAKQTSVPSAWHFTAPVIDETGVINIAWISLSDFSQPDVLTLIQFTPGTGWGFVEVSPKINSSSSLEMYLKLFTSANDEIVAITQDSHGNLFAINFSPTATPFWGKWENIDYNLNRNNDASRAVNITSNGTNNIMVLWSERTKNTDGTLIYRIYSNKYDPVGDANGGHWPIPERVGAILPQFDSIGNKITQYQTHPRIALMADGRAIASWLDSSELKSILFTNQYTPGTGWNATPNEVIAYDRLLTGTVNSPDVSLLANGTVLLSWRQDIETEFATEIHTWLTEGQLN